MRSSYRFTQMSELPPPVLPPPPPPPFIAIPIPIPPPVGLVPFIPMAENEGARHPHTHSPDAGCWSSSSFCSFAGYCSN